MSILYIRDKNGNLVAVPYLSKAGGADITVPNYWQSYLSGKTAEINSAINAAEGNRSAFLWYTDAHWANNYKMSPVLLKYLSKNTGMTKTFFGGDIAFVCYGGAVAYLTDKGVFIDIKILCNS